MRILVTGASGFAGSVLVPRLLSDGHAVRALGRDPARVRAALSRARGPGRTPGEGGAPEILRGDALTGEGLSRALEGVEIAYYLIHSLERPRASAPAAVSSSPPHSGPEHPSAIGPFQERERIAADTFATAAMRAGVRRIVYLGGLLGRGSAPTSRHLASRKAVERILLDAVPDSVALRASIVIDARSRSFRFLVRLVERMPVLTLPAWRNFHTQPIDGRDITEMLTVSASAAVGGRSLDVGGPEVLSYGEMIARIAEVMLVNRPLLGFSLNMTPLAARLAAAIAGEDPELVLPLMEGLRGDLLAADDHAAELLGVELHSFDSAVEHALSEWESSERLAAR
jgi:uncharacterized protein YbjT (DUF2867 family)